MATPQRGRNQAEVDDVLTKIKAASEQIFAAVHAPDDGLSLAQIKQKMQWQTPLCD
jgi:wyosine [tRNA(Phe)-imidazoG37] synthetase (radical SAM superfamily)